MAVKKVTLKACLGNDTESNPLTLFDSFLENGVGYTHLSSDVYSNGTYLAQKRPGMAQAGAAAAVNSMIYDLKKVRLSTPFPTGSVGIDVLMGIYRRASNVAGVATWDPNSSYALADLGATRQTDASQTCRMVVAGPDGVYLTTTVENASLFDPVDGVFVATTAGTSYAIQSWPSSPPTDGNNWVFLIAAWHKSHLFWAGGSRHNRGARVTFGPFNNPGGVYSSQDNFDLDNTGATRVHGIISLGEIMLFGKSYGMWRLTGSVRETFRVERIATPFGFVGMRSVDVLAPGIAVGFVTEEEFASGTAAEQPPPRNIALITGGEVKVIGDRVLTAIRLNNPDAFTQSRVKTWPALRGALLIPDIQEATSAATPALFYSTDTGGFWPWSIAAAMMPDSLEYAERDMFVGCGDGLLRRFNTSSSQDGSTNIGAYWQTPPIRIGTRFNIERVDCYASQTSGGSWSVQVATNRGSLGTAATFTPGSSATRNKVTWTSVNATGNIQEVRVTMPTNGVGCRLDSMDIYLKDIGGEGD